MEYVFHWATNISGDIRNSAEANLSEDREIGNLPITFCHEGMVVVTLSSPDPLQTTFEGNMKCSCGKIRGKIKGASDGSSIAYELVEN